MADSFDPWHVWLGVSPQQQPPNHYRLLGMTLFEHNEDVIDTAASRQSAALREQSSGKHVDQAEQVLAQIATARACLLHRKHRTRYDQQLRDELNRRGVVIPAAVKIPEAEPGYHLWLGIPPAQQPPNHYCLLGIETFEESSEVIEAGAARQTVYLREVSTGPHRKLSQQLLNNVAAARRCLLETDRKRQYDEELKRGTAQAAEAGMVQAESAPAPAITTVADILADPEQRGMSAETESAPVSIAPPAGLTAKPQRPTHGSLSPEKRKSAILIGVVSCLGLLLLLAGWIRGPGTPPDGDQVAGTRPESSRETGHVPQDGTGESDAALAIQPNVSSTGLNGLLGHWSFDEKNSAWAQNSVTPLPVVLHGQPEFTAGPLGSAVQCLGPQQFLELPAGVLDSDAGTIAFWMRRGKQTETGNGIQLVSTTGQGAKLDLRVTDGGQIQCSLGARSQPVDVSVGLTPEVWFHLALTWDRDDGATLYCNAKQIGAAERIGQVGLPIGVRMGATRPDVSFDDVRCFNRALQEQDLRPLIETVSIALQAPETLSSATGETVAAIDRTSAGTMPGERSTDVPVASKSEQSKNRPGDSRKNKARRPRIPQAPAARKVIFPEAASHAVSQVWKNLAPVSLDGLIAATGENRKSQWRTLPALAAVGKTKTDAQSGQRVRGFLVPPLSGRYVFQVQFQGQGTFQLSADQSAQTKRVVKDGEEILLAADQTYYFEVLHVNVDGAGTFQVGWTLPNGSQEKTIPATRLVWTPHLTRFSAIPVTSFESSAGLKLRRVEKTQRLQVAIDSKVPSNVGSTITIDSISDMTSYSAFRIDALYDPEVNPDGTGLGKLGSFEIREIRLSYQEPGSDVFVPVSLAAPVAHSGIPARAVDGDESTVWRVSRRATRTTSIMLVPVDRLVVRPRTKLRFELKQKSSPGLIALLSTSAKAERQIEKIKAAIEREKKPYELLVNLGNTDWTDPRTKKKWLRTKKYQAGTWGHSGGQLKEKKDFNAPAEILKTALEGITAFRADVPNGDYEVTLYFLDHWSTRSAERTFMVQLESETPVAIDARQQSARLLSDIPPRRMKTKVIDGRLDISFRKKKASGQKSILSAVSIVRSR